MKYYSFRYNDNWYGGIATAYCSECNLNCIYCYSHNKRDTGRDRSAREVADKLMKLASKHGVDKCRISGGECTLDMDHLLEVIRIIMDESDLEFWMETNGIIIGKNPEFVEKFAEFPKDRLYVTVSLKHIEAESFAKLTGAPKGDVEYSKLAVERLVKKDVTTRIAFMTDWYDDKEHAKLIDWAIITLIMNTGWYDGTKSEDEATDHLLTLLDFEEFRKYKSVPLKKQEILDILKS
jgi:uncharacterized Fe-S cluster-containing radical SAM superfamily protein